MCSAQLEVMDEMEGQKTAANPETGEEYLRQNGVGRNARWCWFKATCGLAMSAVSPWEIRAKKAAPWRVHLPTLPWSLGLQPTRLTYA